MNATLCRTTDVELELGDMVSPGEGYETAPIIAITPLPQLPDEEELHMGFEEALSERTTAFGERFSHLRNSAWYTEVSSVPFSPLATPTTEPLSELALAKTATAHTDCVDATQIQTVKQAPSKFFNRSVQRAAIFCCFALSCMLLGFDVMGLLILHMH